MIPFLTTSLFLFCLLSHASGHAPETKPDQRPRFIAIVAPFSGPLAEYGRSMLRGGKARMDEQGSQSAPPGGVVSLISLDDRGEVTRAMQLAKHIPSRSSITAVVGHLTTGCTRAAIPFYTAARVATISPVATGSDLDNERSPYLFRTILSESQQARSLARYIHRTMGKPTVALVYEDSFLGIQLKHSFLIKCEELGLSVKHFSLESNPTTGLRDTIHKLAMLRPEVIFSAGGVRSTALIIRKWPEGIDKPLIFGTYRLISEEFRELVGDHQRGIMAAHPSIWASDFHRGTEIMNEYQKTWKCRMDWLAAQTYDAVDLLVWAIRESGSDPASLQEVLRGLDSKKHARPGLAGSIYFNRNGSLARGVTVAEYINGRWRLRQEETVGSKK